MPIASDGKGNYLSLNPDGEWVPAQRARNPETGQELILDGQEWKPVPSGNEPSALASAARGVVRGVMLGFNDEAKALVGGIKGAFTDEGFGPAYDRTLAEARAVDKADAETNPGSSFAGEMVGGVGGAVLTGGATAAMRAPAVVGQVVAPVTNRLMAYVPQAARVIGSGAAVGGVTGFGTGQGDFGSRLENAGESAIIGGAAAGATNLVARGAAGLGRRVGHAFGAGDPNATAERLINRSISRSGQTLDDIDARLRAAGDNPVTIMDASGRPTVALGATTANTPSDAMEAADRFVQARRLGRPDRLTTMGDQAFGGGSGDDIATVTAQRQAQRQADAAPLYEQAFNRPVGMTEPIKAVIDDPISRAGLARGMEIQRIDNAARAARGKPTVPLNDPAVRFAEDGTPQIVGAPTMRTLDAVKRGLDKIIDEARDGTTGLVKWDERLRAVDDLRKAYVKLLDQGNPAYAEARAAWAGPSSQMEATAAGRTALRTDRDVVSARMANAAPDVQDAYRLGAGRDFADRVSDPARAPGAARLMLEDGQMQARLAAILPPDQLAALNAGLRREVDMTAVERAVSPRANSQTGRLLAGVDDMSKPPLGPWATAALQLVSGHPIDATRTVASDQWRRFGQGISPATSDALANRLFTVAPRERAAVVQSLRNRLMTDQIQTEIARARLRPVLHGAAVAAASQND